MADPDYGLTIKCTDDLDPLLSTVSGTEAMKYAMLRRVYTPEGTLMSDPTAITMDARELCNKALTVADEPIIKSRFYQCWIEDERVLDVTISVEFDFLNNTFRVKGDGVGAYGPFSLTVSVNVLTVELLKS